MNINQSAALTALIVATLARFGPKGRSTFSESSAEHFLFTIISAILPALAAVPRTLTRLACQGVVLSGCSLSSDISFGSCIFCRLLYLNFFSCLYNGTLSTHRFLNGQEWWSPLVHLHCFLPLEVNMHENIIVHQTCQKHFVFTCR